MIPDPFGGDWALGGALAFMFAGWVMWLPIWLVSKVLN